MEKLSIMTTNNIGKTVTISKLGSSRSTSDERILKVAGQLDSIVWMSEENPHPQIVKIAGEVFLTSDDSEFEPSGRDFY